MELAYGAGRAGFLLAMGLMREIHNHQYGPRPRQTGPGSVFCAMSRPQSYLKR